MKLGIGFVIGGVVGFALIFAMILSSQGEKSGAKK